jgi:hypothetical protein
MSNQAPYSSPPENRPTNTMAIVSLVAGILGLSFIPLIGSIVAVITGPMAKKEIQQSMGSMDGEGLAKAGMIIGWIGIALGVMGCCGMIIAFVIPMILVATQNSGSFLPFLISVL